MVSSAIIFVIVGLVHRIQCDSTDSSFSTTEEIADATEAPSLGNIGLYGGWYYKYRTSDSEHYIHGTYQTPTKDYYRMQEYYGEDDFTETFDYYLGFGISRINNNDFEYKNFHYRDHDLNRTIFENETIPSSFVISCHPTAIFCPENTETICLLNGTIYCMSRISAVVPCQYNATEDCISTLVPCVRACLDISYDFEEIYVPCLATVMIEDVYEDGKGKTLSKVGGTFVLVDALEKEDLTFCVTVIVDPQPK